MAEDKKKDKKKSKEDKDKKKKKDKGKEGKDSPKVGDELVTALSEDEKARLAEDQMKGWDSILKEKETRDQQQEEGKKEKPTLTRRISERFKIGGDSRARAATESSRLIANANGVNKEDHTDNKGRPPSKSFDNSARPVESKNKTDPELIKEFLQRHELEKYDKCFADSVADFDTFLSLTPDDLAAMGVNKKHLKALGDAIAKEKAKRENDG